MKMLQNGGVEELCSSYGLYGVEEKSTPGEGRQTKTPPLKKAQHQKSTPGKGLEFQREFAPDIDIITVAAPRPETDYLFYRCSVWSCGN